MRRNAFYKKYLDLFSKNDLGRAIHRSWSNGNRKRQSVQICLRLGGIFSVIPWCPLKLINSLSFCVFFLFPLVDFHLLNLAFVLCLNMSVLLRPECAGLFGAALIVFVLNFWTGLLIPPRAVFLPSQISL
jgi:hypothetical protein